MQSSVIFRFVDDKVFIFTMNEGSHVSLTYLTEKRDRRLRLIDFWRACRVSRILNRKDRKLRCRIRSRSDLFRRTFAVHRPGGHFWSVGRSARALIGHHLSNGRDNADPPPGDGPTDTLTDRDSRDRAAWLAERQLALRVATQKMSELGKRRTGKKRELQITFAEFALYSLADTIQVLDVSRTRDGTGYGFLTRDPTRPDQVSSLNDFKSTNARK